MSEAPFDVTTAHRWFAIECNNRAWDLIEANERSAAQLEEMIHLAHTALFHWSQAGTELNLLRAEVLLVATYCAANRSESALVYAVSLKTRLSSIEELTLFDRASVAGAIASAYQLSSQPDKATDFVNEFHQELAQIEEVADQDLLRRLFPVAT